jgi:excisionase family DNA binding protein
MSILAARMAAIDGPRHSQATPTRPVDLPAIQTQDNRLALSMREAAELVGVHPRTLAKWPLPFFKMGHIVRVRREDLDNFLRSRATMSTATPLEN